MDILNMMVDDLKEFLIYITGSTPESVCSKVMSTIHELSSDGACLLVDAVVLAATGRRKPVTDHVMAESRAEISKYPMKHFSINEIFNFTAINFLGHCFLAGGLATKGQIVTDVRAKFDVESIWNVDLEKAKLSATQREIIDEKVLKFPREMDKKWAKLALAVVDIEKDKATTTDKIIADEEELNGSEEVQETNTDAFEVVNKLRVKRKVDDQNKSN